MKILLLLIIIIIIIFIIEKNLVNYSISVLFCIWFFFFYSQRHSDVFFIRIVTSHRYCNKSAVNLLIRYIFYSRCPVRLFQMYILHASYTVTGVNIHNFLAFSAGGRPIIKIEFSFFFFFCFSINKAKVSYVFYTYIRARGYLFFLMAFFFSISHVYSQSVQT